MRRKVAAAIILPLLLIGGSAAALFLSSHSSPTTFNASFSDLQGYSINSGSYLTSKVSSTDFTVLAVPLASEQFHLLLKSHDPSQEVNASVIDVYTNKTYEYITGRNVSITINSGAVEFKQNAPANLTAVGSGSNLSGPIDGRTLGIDLATNNSFAASLPASFDANLEAVGNQSTNTFNTASASISIGNQTVINGTTTSGVTFKIVGDTTFDASLIRESNASLILGQFSQDSINPRSFPTPSGMMMNIAAPLGRINTTSGSTSLLGVENVTLKGAINSVTFSNDSGRIRTTFSGKSDYLLVDGNDITKVSISEFVSENVPILGLLATVCGFIPLYIDLWKRRKSRPTE